MICVREKFGSGLFIVPIVMKNVREMAGCIYIRQDIKMNKIDILSLTN